MTERLTVPPGPDATHQFEMPPISNPNPRLYALLAVEVAPGKIVYYHLELDHTPGACTIDLSPQLYGPWHINAAISAIVVSDRPDYQPPARTAPAQQKSLPAAAAVVDAIPGGGQ